MGCLLIIITGLLMIFFSWLITCGIIKLITLCFGLVFTWSVATGIWLIIFLIGGGIKIKIGK